MLRQTATTRTSPADSPTTLSAQELLAGSLLTYDVTIPAAVLRADGQGASGRVCLRPLKVATLALIAKAAREDSALVPLLMIKESLVEPSLQLDQVRALHVGLVQFLVSEVHRISGLDSQNVRGSLNTPISETHLLLARHFGWTPDQVAELTPGQVALYLAGIERLLALEAARKQAP